MMFSLSYKTIWEMGKMQAKENFLTYTEFGEKTQIVILMRQYDLKCKFKKKSVVHTCLPSLLIKLVFYQVVFTVGCFPIYT